MKTSDILRDEREQIIQAMRTASDKAKGRQLTKEERAQFDVQKVQVEELNERIGFFASRESEEAGAAMAGYAKGAPAHFANVRDTRMAQSLLGAFQSGSKVNEKNAPEHWNSETRRHYESRTLNSTTGAAAVQNPLIANNPLFYALSSNFMSLLGIGVVDIANYTQHPQVTGYPTLTPYTEAQSIPVSTATIGAVKFEAKNYGFLLKLHKNLLRDASPLVLETIQGMIERGVIQSFLEQTMYGTTASNGFAGLDTVSGVQTVDAGGDILSNYTTFTAAARKSMTANAELDKIGYLMHPIVWEQLQDAADTTGQPLVMPSGLTTRPMAVSTAVKTDYGTSPDFTTRVYAGDFSTVQIGIEGRYEIFLDQTFAADDVAAFAIVVRADMKVLEPAKLVRIENIGLA